MKAVMPTTMEMASPTPMVPTETRPLRMMKTPMQKSRPNTAKMTDQVTLIRTTWTVDAPVVFVRSRCRPRQQICHICNELGAQVPTRAQSRVYEKIQFICELPLEHAQGVIFDRRKFLQEHLICLCELVSKAVHPLLSKHSELLKPLRYALPVLIGKSRVQAPVQLVNDRRYAYLLVRLPAVFKQALLELFDTPLYRGRLSLLRRLPQLVL
mmetsp:Transcript_97/g.281  ORF Transcript_97/g.281 Transcript_97/m.281 type:complete len:211 (-) Transcript_97:149-781(-)